MLDLSFEEIEEGSTPDSDHGNKDVRDLDLDVELYTCKVLQAPVRHNLPACRAFTVADWPYSHSQPGGRSS